MDRFAQQFFGRPDRDSKYASRSRDKDGPGFVESIARTFVSSAASRAMGQIDGERGRSGGLDHEDWGKLGGFVLEMMKGEEDGDKRSKKHKKRRHRERESDRDMPRDMGSTEEPTSTIRPFASGTVAATKKSTSPTLAPHAPTATGAPARAARAGTTPRSTCTA
ncbi:hypothetical protein G7Z17_g7575 [Cylindrodendrum hubeiense]|uniref:Uncharacterized protein n=1 Tax=Cylindrodendrum hubeiense TaxID=595255 RepID=A0A9P5H5B2_9HYPO|nr:hypothetical protein G7Z17_g7575 [Cylindrodendrum hubeiense]